VIMNLYVGNLSPETTEDDLRNIFSEFGEIVSARILRDNETGMPRGFGFVEMADKYHGYDAIDNLDVTYLQGQIISVKEAKQRTNERDSRGGARPFAPRGGSGSYGDRPRPRPDRPAYGGDRPAYGSDRPAYGSDRPAYGSGDRPARPDSGNTDRPDRGDRSDRERFKRRF
jgi:RNA recognition motif-containing protein